MPDVVYARVDTLVVWSQGTSPIAKGDVWDAEAPLVAERPDLFSAEPTRIRGQVYRAPVVDKPETAPDQGEKAAARTESARVVDKARPRKGS